MTKYAIMDTETTGLSSTALPVEVACVLTDENFDISIDGKFTASVVINPFMQNSMESDILEKEKGNLIAASRVHQLSNNTIKKGLAVRSLFEVDNDGEIVSIKVGDVRIDRDTVLIFHNAEYDMGIMYNAAVGAGLKEQFLRFVKGVEVIDTVGYFRTKRVGKKNSLGIIAKAMRISHEDVESILKDESLACPPDRRIRHAALYDCILLCKVLAEDQAQKMLLSDSSLDSFRRKGTVFIKKLDLNANDNKEPLPKTVVVLPTEEEKQAHLAMMKKIKDIMNRGKGPNEDPVEPIWGMDGGL